MDGWIKIFFLHKDCKKKYVLQITSKHLPPSLPATVKWAVLFCHFFLFVLSGFLSPGSILWFVSWEEVVYMNFYFWWQKHLKHIYKNRFWQLHASFKSTDTVSVTQSQSDFQIQNQNKYRCTFLIEASE